MNISAILFLGILFGSLVFFSFVGFVYLPLYYKYKSKWFRKKYPLFWNLKKETDIAYAELSDKGWEIQDIKNKIDKLFKGRIYLLSEDRKECLECIKKYRTELKIKEKEYVRLEEIKNQKQDKLDKYIAENKITKFY